MLPLSIPKRLLRISENKGDDEARLYLEDSTTESTIALGLEKYSALTYCWGGDQEIKLNAASTGALQQGISISILPKTLHDAALLSWNFDLRLIWIDCLCIMQDDPRELAQEIANLPAIFGNAYITISASRVAHSREGFLQPVSYPPRDNVSFKLPYACPDGRLGSVLLYSYQYKNPIASRAWTFQEFMLSRRVLAYTSSQLTWTCRNMEWFQEKKQASLIDMYKLYTSLHNGVRDCETWMTLVWSYSLRTLTFSGDMLPAISGIAEVWDKSSDSYIAGLWLSHLPLGLLWISEQPFLQEEGQDYRAPSWSWACLNGSTAWYKYMLTTVDPDFSILSCTAVPTYHDAPYGTVSSGFLVARGHLKESVLPLERVANSTTPSNNTNIDLLMRTTSMRTALPILQIACGLFKMLSRLHPRLSKVLFQKSLQ